MSRADEQLKELGERIEAWRAQRRGREMPAELWAAAAALARREGVSRVATALGLGWASLKERVARAGSPRPVGKRAGFVEVSGAQLLTSPGPGAVTLEVTRGEVRLVLTLPSASGLDVMALVAGVLRP